MFGRLVDNAPGPPWQKLHSKVVPLSVAGRLITDINEARQLFGDVVEPYLEVARANAARDDVKIDHYEYTIDGSGSGQYRVTVYGFPSGCQ